MRASVTFLRALRDLYRRFSVLGLLVLGLVFCSCCFEAMRGGLLKL